MSLDTWNLDFRQIFTVGGSGLMLRPGLCLPSRLYYVYDTATGPSLTDVVSDVMSWW